MMIQVERLGIYISKPIAFILLVIYLVQSAMALYLITEKYNLEKQIGFQQKRITELEEKLRLYKAIEDLQIGFTDDEVKTLTNTIYTESQRYGYDPLFVVSIILTESTFKREQVSEKGATGLMQLMPSTGADVAPRAGVDWLGPQTLMDPESNVRMGMHLLFEQVLKHGDLKKALVAYNMGEYRMMDYVEQNRPLPKGYFEKVINTYQRLKETYRV